MNSTHSLLPRTNPYPPANPSKQPISPRQKCCGSEKCEKSGPAANSFPITTLETNDAYFHHGLLWLTQVVQQRPRTGKPPRLRGLAFFTRWRGKVRERPVRTRRAPLGALGRGMPRPYVLEPCVEHGERAERSNGGPLACFDRQPARMRARRVNNVPGRIHDGGL